MKISAKLFLVFIALVICHFVMNFKKNPPYIVSNTSYAFLSYSMPQEAYKSTFQKKFEIMLEAEIQIPNALKANNPVYIIDAALAKQTFFSYSYEFGDFKEVSEVTLDNTNYKLKDLFTEIYEKSGVAIFIDTKGHLTLINSSK